MISQLREKLDHHSNSKEIISLIDILFDKVILKKIINLDQDNSIDLNKELKTLLFLASRKYNFFIKLLDKLILRNKINKKRLDKINKIVFDIKEKYGFDINKDNFDKYDMTEIKTLIEAIENIIEQYKLTFDINKLRNNIIDTASLTQYNMKSFAIELNNNFIDECKKMVEIIEKTRGIVKPEEKFGRIIKRERLDDFFDNCPIVFSTTLSIDWMKTKSKFDHAIIDEATQTTIHSAFGLSNYFNNITFLGDTKQLKAVVVLDKEKESHAYADSNLPYVYRNNANSVSLIIERLLPKRDSVLLNEHWRCQPHIANFFNIHYYNNELVIKRSSSDENQLDITVFHGNWKQNIEKLLNDQYSNEFNEGKIAIMSPFNKIEKIGLNKNKLKIGTTHKFQGYENDIIIYTLPDEEKSSFVIDEFLDNPNLINVALSRAKNKFHLLIGEKTYDSLKNKKGNNLTNLINYIENKDSLEMIDNYYSVLTYWLTHKPRSIKFVNEIEDINVRKKDRLTVDYKKIKVNSNVIKFADKFKLNYTFGVRDIDVFEDIKSIENHKKIYDFVFFDNEGNIYAVYNNDEFIFKNSDSKRSTKKLMTINELKLYHNIKKQLKWNKQIYPSVSLNWLTNAFDKELTTKMHIDFILADYFPDKQYIESAFGIELDDPTHKRNDSQKKDMHKNKICQDLGITLIRKRIFW